eukprot:TRINITY_DN11898_c0_g1_i6.p1 TRINITY_DN11898_c0_g1~~TRINITY_DN11898_c0_g1_i6.p1  ORF type:complete len:330 (+),score=75.37 TRINITY_DN11898_c0_g1_i6:47-991(+)
MASTFRVKNTFVDVDCAQSDDADIASLAIDVPTHPKMCVRSLSDPGCLCEKSACCDVSDAGEMQQLVMTGLSDDEETDDEYRAQPLSCYSHIDKAIGTPKLRCHGINDSDVCESTRSCQSYDVNPEGESTRKKKDSCDGGESLQQTLDRLASENIRLTQENKRLAERWREADAGCGSHCSGGCTPVICPQQVQSSRHDESGIIGEAVTPGLFSRFDGDAQPPVVFFAMPFMVGGRTNPQQPVQHSLPAQAQQQQEKEEQQKQWQQQQQQQQQQQPSSSTSTSTSSSSISGSSNRSICRSQSNPRLIVADSIRSS